MMPSTGRKASFPKLVAFTLLLVKMVSFKFCPLRKLSLWYVVTSVASAAATAASNSKPAQIWLLDGRSLDEPQLIQYESFMGLSSALVTGPRPLTVPKSGNYLGS